MQYKEPTFTLLGFLEFSFTVVLMVTITAALTFAVAYAGARQAHTGKPSGMQNFMEWMVEFIRGLVGSTMHSARNNQFVMLALALIMFIFIGNFLSIPFKITTDNYYILWKAPTSDPHVTLTLAITVIVLSNILGIRMLGFKEYFLHYFKPQAWQFPLHIIEEFAKTLTLGLRLFGNIFAKETLAGMLAHAGFASVVGAVAFALPMIAWQAFGIFVGAIQAFVFTILTLVYIAQKVEPDH
ncbi:F-type H+-transporting ATPase subunit a [Caldalkalibacillus uzonensis]|uniref:ATP synthase subunit a n=1 Tax=Caldalkalibacillus uzonensis TaxID=353224 RepID=A0ABU0CSL9_9BACI|nr:F0F1 ATP synthase subunit A [Caldalkalibacillus uzonensis]MDQ0339414.1 F-type H+-transporting ATPase subunit a [Caldalkalibacillus uzonensis]